VGRPPLPPGTYGEIRAYPVNDGKFRAVTNYRDYDGVTRPVERHGKGRTTAVNRLKEALRDRTRRVAGDEIGADTRMSEVARLWFREIDESDRATRTKRTYRESWDRDVAHRVGRLRIVELTGGAADRVLREIREQVGPASARHAKVVLGGIMGLAVRRDAVKVNPIREIKMERSRKKGRRHDRFRLDPETLPDLQGHMRSSELADRYDLVDFVDLESVLGARIGEALALDWTKVDWDEGSIAIEGTVIRIPGQGLIVQPYTKSEAGMRTLYLAAPMVGRLRARFAESTSRWVFPSSTGTLRDPDNTRRQLRSVFAGTQWEGLHPHAFRRLVATVLDAAGLSAREIADYLGHEKISTTQNDYMERQARGVRAARALGSVLNSHGEKRG
jgi:integrase